MTLRSLRSGQTVALSGGCDEKRIIGLPGGIRRRCAFRLVGTVVQTIDSVRIKQKKCAAANTIYHPCGFRKGAVHGIAPQRLCT